MPENKQVIALFAEFLKGYASDDKDRIWQSHSATFRKFLSERVWTDDGSALDDNEIDVVVRILDRNGKGNTKNTEAVARAMTPQGAWRRMFNDIRKKKELSSLIKGMLTSTDEDEAANFIDKLYHENAKNKNNLTGKSGTAIGAFFAAYDPFKNSSMISLNDRHLFFRSFKIALPSTFDAMSIGGRILATNRIWLEALKGMGVTGNARTLSVFCYWEGMRNLWKDMASEPLLNSPPREDTVSDAVEGEAPPTGEDKNLFYIESQLEDFLIQNWENTDLGKKYDLLKENDELVSQQYRTDIGIIDILAKDKKDGRYVIIELKRNQTSDATIGQLTRYMGWIEENKSDGQPTRGVIIAGEYDSRIYYAVKKVPDVEVYEYRVEFHLEAYKKH